MKIKGWIYKIISIPYANEADKKLIEQSIKSLVKSVEGAKAENARCRVDNKILDNLYIESWYY